MNKSDLNGSNMSRPSVTSLYSRFATSKASTPLPDADQLAAQMASSPAHAELLRFSRDLEPVSAALGADLAAALNESNTSAAHRRDGVSRRIGAGSRRWRSVAAFAATLVAAVVVWNTQRSNMPTVVAPMASTASASDRIFAAYSESIVTTEHRGSSDEIFRGEFRTDEIFNSNTHGG
jgi:hypothetical protein